MSARYFPLDADIDGNVNGEDYLSRTVHEAEPEKPEFSGLYDAAGRKLYRAPAVRQIGFVRHGGTRG